MRDLPSLIVALTIAGYWLGVAVMLVRARLLYRREGGVRPRKPGEQLVWPLWVAAVAGWILIPWLARVSSRPWLGLPDWSSDLAWVWNVRLAASLLGVCCLLVTINCWRMMGRSWSIATIPGERTELITQGMYSYIRHPIYSLSILLMLMTMIAVPVPVMIGIGAIHILLMNFKARSEEQELHAQHGDAYARMCRRTGRFFPRFWPPAPPESQPSPHG